MSCRYVGAEKGGPFVVLLHPGFRGFRSVAFSGCSGCSAKVKELEQGQISTPRELAKTVHRLSSIVPVGGSPISPQAQAIPQLDDPITITITIIISYPQSIAGLDIHQRIEYEAGQVSTHESSQKPSTVPVGG